MQQTLALRHLPMLFSGGITFDLGVPFALTVAMGAVEFGRGLDMGTPMQILVTMNAVEFLAYRRLRQDKIWWLGRH